MPLAITPLNVQDSGNTLVLRGRLTPSGSYVTDGDTLDFTSVIGQGVLGKTFQAGKAPLTVLIAPSIGNTLKYVKATSPSSSNAFGLANGKVLCFTSNATQLAASAYPAAMIADLDIYFEAVFDKLL